MGDIRASEEDTTHPVPPNSQVIENEVTVLVTGFGPFLKQFPVNPSHEIVKKLPHSLTLTNKPLPTKAPTATTTRTRTRITITTPAHPLTVAYHPTHAAISGLLSPAPPAPVPDLALHIGLAAGRSYFAIEKSSARHGYDRNADVDGRRWTPDDSRKAWPDEMPARLETGLGFEAVWERWRKGCEGVDGVVAAGAGAKGVRRGRGVGVGGEGDEGVPSGPPVEVGLGGLVRRQGEEKKKGNVVEVRPSDDVGSYLCGFIYYNSLAWFWEKERREKEEEEGKEAAAVERPVLFLHVPACPDERDVERGKEITVELIKAMVATWLAQKETAEAR